MTVTIEQFQNGAKPWLDKVKETGEAILIVSGDDTFEVRSAPSPLPSSEEALEDLEKRLPRRNIIVGDPEDLVHMDGSSEWRPSW